MSSSDDDSALSMLLDVSELTTSALNLPMPSRKPPPPPPGGNKLESSSSSSDSDQVQPPPVPTENPPSLSSASGESFSSTDNDFDDAFYQQSRRSMFGGTLDFGGMLSGIPADDDDPQSTVSAVSSDASPKMPTGIKPPLASKKKKHKSPAAAFAASSSASSSGWAPSRMKDDAQGTLTNPPKLVHVSKNLSVEDQLSTDSASGEHRQVVMGAASSNQKSVVQCSNTTIVKNSADDAFIIEKGNKANDDLNAASISLMDPDRYTPYYQHYFHKKNSFIFIAWDYQVKPIILAVERISDELLSSVPPDEPVHVRVLLRCVRSTCKEFDIDEWRVLALHDRKGASNPKTLRRILVKTFPALLQGAKIVQVDQHKLADDLLVKLESNLLVARYKFAVMYCKEGQTEELEMLHNTTSSQDFIDFLHFLGDEIELKGYQGFKGDLDVRNGSTGEKSFATTFNTYDIMYHVSTLLPYTPRCEQQVNKKRYMGNDVVMIVFKEGDEVIEPSTFCSHFNHVFVFVKVVKKLDGRVFYAVNVASKRGVTTHMPGLPDPPVFERCPRFRTWLLSKCVNGQRASFRAPGFLKSLTRTRLELMNSFVNTVYDGNLPKPRKKPQLSTTLKTPKIKNKSKSRILLHKKKSSLASSDDFVISGPNQPGRHVGHVGLDADTSTFQVKNLPPEIQEALDAMKSGQDPPQVVPQKNAKKKSSSSLTSFIKRK